MDSAAGPPPWWRSAVLYQVYIRSFADSDGDGVGDLRGVLAHLDHLQWLGVDGLWVGPVMVSPDADWGYDVADHCAIQPGLGTIEDFDLLVREAGRRDMRVLVDVVPNHTSDRHPWFVDARSSRESSRRDWYVWADPGPDGGPPNNWASSCGGPAWTLDGASGQYYLHNHLPEQPDLNWWNPDVGAAFDDILRFWFDRGVAGLRVDVCNLIVKDAELRDNPPATEDDDLDVQLLGQRTVYNGNRPEVHAVFRHWHQLVKSYDEAKVLVGETPVPVAELARYYGAGDELELDLSFNSFPFLQSPFEAPALQKVVADTERLLPVGAWPAWTGSYHDVSRMATRWGAGDPSAHAPGAGHAAVPARHARALPGRRDRARGWDGRAPRPARPPRRAVLARLRRARMAPAPPRRGAPGPEGGFTEPGTRTWLPMADPDRCNVEDQRADAGSVLTLVRDLLALRRRTPDLRTGAYRVLTAPDGVWAWRRGDAVTVVLNLSDEAAAVTLSPGLVPLGTDRGRDHGGVGDTLALGPWEGVVLADADAG